MSKICMGCMASYEDEYDVCPHCGYIEGTKPEQALHMEPGSILQERFIVGKSIGYGGFGVTYIGWDALLEHRVAIKEYLPSEFSTRMPGVTQVTVFNGDKSEQFRDGLRQFVSEAKKLAKFNNVEGIVKIYDSFEENNTAYIVMEYLEGETLAQRLERDKIIDPDEAIAMLTPVIQSLEKVHEQGIIHRDIAPDNLFITKDGTVKVIDFGAARFATTSHSRSLTVIIKPGFSPEEQYRSRKEQGGYTDVYAIGATLYKMITGVTPPDALERYAMAESKSKDILEPISKYCKKIDEDQENAILNALNIRIEDRTASMALLLGELHSDQPVKRIYGRIKKTDTLRWPLWAKIATPIAVLALLIVGILFATGVIGFHSTLQREIKIPDGMTRVPSVVNNKMDVAETRLTEAVLLYTIAGKEYSVSVPANYVLSQDLLGGVFVQKNSLVNIVVSGGAETGVVPQVTNIPYEEAAKLLEEVGFVASKIETYSSAIEKGYVISQDVEADMDMPLGSVITLTVSKGVDPDEQIEIKEITLPDFTGKTYDEVLAFAESNSIKVTVSDRRYSDQFAANTIMQHSPAAGKTIVTGETLSVVVSQGKQTIKVPDVQYKNKAEAKEILEALGLKVVINEVESETVAAGLVISQSIQANANVDPGETITLTVSKGAASFAMPNVVGMTEANAKNTLTGKGISVSVTYQYSNKTAGTVLQQSISANTQVTRGTAVTLTVSSGEETVTVPNVVGQTAADAQSTLKSKGFAVSVNQVYSDTVAEGKVISQNPNGGSSQTKGSTIVITVSLGKDTAKSIAVAAKPTKPSYFVGETLNSAGLTLTVTYKSGSTQTVSGGYTCSPMTLNTVGTQTITVTYQGCTTTFTVSVDDIVLNNLSVKTKPSKTSYLEGDTLNTSGLVLTAKYSNGSTQEITTGFTCTPTTLSTPGTQTITVRYQTKSCTFTVDVAPIIEATEVRLYLNGSLITNTTAGATTRVGRTTQFSAEIMPQNTTNKSITWKSSNAAVAKIDSNGLLTALSLGSTTITASAQNGVQRSLKVEVVGLDIGISLDVDSVTDTFDGKSYGDDYSWNDACFHPGDDIIIRYELKLNNMSWMRTGIDEVSIEVSDTGMVLQSVSGNGCSGKQSGKTITITNTKLLEGGEGRVVYIDVLYKTPSSAEQLTLTINGKITKARDEGGQSQTYTGSDGNDSDTVSFSLKAFKDNVLASGTCGSNLTWKLTDDGMLKISGSGAMKDYAYSSNATAPWFNYTAEVKSLSLPNGLTNIGQYAFLGCYNATSVNLPGSLTSIGDGAFYSCRSLTGVTIPNGVTSIGARAFQDCEKLASVEIPSSVKSIGEYAFCDCYKLKKVSVPNGVTSISKGAFLGCSGLTSVTIPSSVTKLGEGSFEDCSGLTSISIPNSVTSIGKNAFTGCKGLSSIVIPGSVTYIGWWAFSDCTGLTSITIPQSVTRIDGYAFEDCSSLSSITFLNSNCAIYKENTTIPTNCTIRGYSGSTAQAYAEQFGRVFELID